MGLKPKKRSRRATSAPGSAGAKIACELASGLKRIPEVVNAYYSFDGSLFRSWVLIDPYELSIRRKVFELQQEIMSGNPGLEFDFYVLAQPKQQPQEPLFTDAAVASRARAK